MFRFRFIKGFSLMEMTITFAILGILITGSVKFIDLYKHRDAEGITKRRLEIIKDALMIYRANNYGALPCPADLTAPLQSDNFGFEGSAQTNSIFHCVGGNVTNLNVANYSIWDGNDSNIPSGGNANVLNRQYHGVVPVRTLNLAPEYAFDGWGNRISYIVHMASINGKSSSMHNNCGTVPSARSWWKNRNYRVNWAQFCGRGILGRLSVYYRNSGSTAYDLRLITNSAEYLLISHGKSGEGGYNAFGSRNELPTSTEKQINTPCQSCSFTGDPYKWIAFSDAMSFDDIVEYETREQQLMRCNNSGIKASKCEYLTLRTVDNA